MLRCYEDATRMLQGSYEETVPSRGIQPLPKAQVSLCATADDQVVSMDDRRRGGRESLLRAVDVGPPRTNTRLLTHSCLNDRDSLITRTIGQLQSTLCTRTGLRHQRIPTADSEPRRRRGRSSLHVARCPSVRPSVSPSPAIC